MRSSYCVVCLVLLLTPVAAQQKRAALPVKLGALVDNLQDSEQTVKVPELIAAIQHQGIAFDVQDKELSDLLAAGARGKRESNEMAALILACLQVCQNCRSRILSPMTKDEVKTLLHLGFSQEAILYEVRVRGLKDMEISEPAAFELREAGASAELVSALVPDDKVPTVPLAGYETLVLKRAEEYDPKAEEGWLKITAESAPASQTEFIFMHTGLFARAIQGSLPKDLAAYYNKAAPTNVAEESIDLKRNIEAVDEKGVAVGPSRKRKQAPPSLIEVSYLGAGSDGRNAFKIVVANKDGIPQRFSFNLRWRVRGQLSPKGG